MLIIKNRGHRARVFSYKHLKLKLRVSLACYTVTAVTCYVMTMTVTCSTMTRHLSDTIIVAAPNRTDFGQPRRYHYLTR